MSALAFLAAPCSVSGSKEAATTVRHSWLEWPPARQLTNSLTFTETLLIWAVDELSTATPTPNVSPRERRVSSATAPSVIVPLGMQQNVLMGTV